jgi:hypothetical protein
MVQPRVPGAHWIGGWVSPWAVWPEWWLKENFIFLPGIKPSHPTHSHSLYKLIYIWNTCCWCCYSSVQINYIQDKYHTYTVSGMLLVTFWSPHRHIH